MELKGNKKQLIYNLLPILSIVTILVAWVILSTGSNSLLPSIAELVEKFIQILTVPLSGATLLGHVWASLKRVLIAFVLVIFIGTALGVGFGWFPKFRGFIYPIFELLRFIPPIAWIPLIILWMGIDEAPKIAIVFIGAVTPVVLNTYAGIQNIDPVLINAGKLLGASRTQLLFEVAIPAATSEIIAGIKTALSSGWMCVVAAEMIVARQGVGFLIVRGQESGDIALIVVCMATIGLVNTILSKILDLTEKVATPWR